MSLTRKDIDEIMALLENSRFDRLYLEMDGVKLELARGGAPRERPSPFDEPMTSGRAEEVASPSLKTARAEPVEAPTRIARQQGFTEVKSPLLGVFYRAPKPGEPPFVEVGDKVEADSVIGIIEVMKLMNSARAGVAGEVVEILATNGEMVEHGEVLMLVRPN